MQPDPTTPQSWPWRVARFVREHLWTVGYLTAMVVAAAWDIHRHPGRLPLWLLVGAGLVAVDAALNRFAQVGTRLDRGTFAELTAAIAAQPGRTLLIDQETRDVLRIRRRWVLMHRSWLVERFAAGTVDEVMEDFNVNQPSTLPVTGFVVGQRGIVSVDDVIAVRRGADGEPEEIPDAAPRHTWREVWFRIRAGATAVAPAQVEHLTTQLRRAEPVPPDWEDGHYAA